MGRLDGKVAIVTGGGRGIGKATVLAMVAEGARVVVLDLDGDAAEAVAAEARAGGGDARGVAGDISQEQDWVRAVAATRDAYGGIDVLHNNAAMTSPDAVLGDGALDTMEVEFWDRVMAVNARGPMLGCKHVIPVMVERGGGSIVNTSSAAGSRGYDTLFAYGASKAAVDSLTRYVATAYGKHGVRCNAVAPGIVRNPTLGTSIMPGMAEIGVASTLTPAVAEVDDIAAVVVFLASDAARSVTGHLLFVDGGLTAHLPQLAQMRALRAGAGGGSG